ncbi:MAG TPA: hypothetical protein VL359_16225, partial [bacterium]|nr:hypothetical protein [bacterium]
RLFPLLKLDRVPHRDPPALLELLRGLVAEKSEHPVGYVVLPSTYPLEAALRLIVQKDALFQGVPRVVLVYVSKFPPEALQQDAELRELYFRALRHNVVVNVDGRKVVDNPQAVGFKLLLETLGCTFDTPQVEEIPEEDEETSTRVVG